ncbi:hypothetical protein MSAN_02092000 [Mycena sanguinolenta]|uniref:Uncharacterized protein n=1 Tax=Mycena sanguinolenta TaxID=230812 RepID=A0A8H6XII6_9AGAR|nr:hypothetical protein MSAN_02092000 [Mycena sanguinolenta]
MRTCHGTLSSRIPQPSRSMHLSSHAPPSLRYWDSKPPTELASIVQAPHVRPSPPTGYVERSRRYDLRCDRRDRREYESEQQHHARSESHERYLACLKGCAIPPARRCHRIVIVECSSEVEPLSWAERAAGAAQRGFGAACMAGGAATTEGAEEAE